MLRALERLGITAEGLRARGWRLRLLNINHWELAIDTIKRNIAFAEMYNATIENVDPSYVLQGQRPHLLIAAAECIMYSPARGNRPIRDQSRTTAAWILNWVDCDPYAIYFENVPEWSTWGELDEQMRPKPEHKGEYYQQFLRALRDRGYDIAEGVVNCADYGDATTRKRLFICGRKKGIGKERVRIPSPTHTKFPQKYPHLQPWVPARAIIDWNLKGEPITHRDRGPHAPPSLRRIRAGYNKQEAILRPVLLELIDRLLPISEAFHAKISARPSEAKLNRKLTKEEKQQNAQVLKCAKAEAKIAIREAFKAPLASFSSSELTQYEREAFAFVLGQQGGATARPISQPLPTIAGGGAIGLATVTDGLIVKANASEKSTFNDATQSLDAPLSTIVTKDCRALAQPALSAAKTLVVNGTVSEKSSRFENSSRSADEPLSTIVGVDRHYLAEPILAVVQHGENDERTPDLNAPLPTVTSKGSTGLASPVIAQLYGSNVACNGGGGVDSVDDPLSTITAGGNHHALAEPLIATVHGLKGNENRCRSTDEPIGTIAAGGNQHALAEPVITSRNNAQKGERRAHTMDEPLPTATGSGAGYLAEPVVAEARVMSNHHGNAGVSINEPLPSATTGTGGGIGVAEPSLTVASDALLDDGPYFMLDGVRVGINILYRMLHSSELARAHSFGDVKFSGAEKDAVKQIGNSIPVETAAAMIGSVILPVLAEFDDLLEMAA